MRQEFLRALLALSVQKLHQIDVTTAFLNSTLEEVFMRQPEGFATKRKEHLVCKLNKSISYGLKQSLNVALNSHRKQMGFSQSNGDPCIDEMVCMSMT